MKNRIRLNIFIAIVAVLFFAIFIFTNVWGVSVEVATVSGSYGEQFAKEHHLKSVALADSQKSYFDQRYEVFDYNYEFGGITVERYSGCSENLVIPMEIDGELVIGIGEDFFSSLNSNVKNIYLPESIVTVDGEPRKDITVFCTDSSIFKMFNDNEKLKIETRYDSEFVNFLLGNLEYEYNVKGDEVEITDYTGNYAEIVVIPSYINGLPVTSLSFDMVGKASVFVIPETVKSITGNTKMALFSSQFAIQFVFTVLAFLISLVVINVLLPRLQKEAGEFALSGSQVVLTIVYVLVQAAFCITTIYFKRIPNILSIVISACILVAYIAFMFMGEAGREHAQKVSAKVEEDTSFMRNLKASTKHLAEGIEDSDIKSQVEKVIEEIRFSKLNGTDPQLDSVIEEDVKELKKKIAEKDYSGIKELASKIIESIRQR